MLVLRCMLLLLVVSPDVGYGKSYGQKCRDPKQKCIPATMCPKGKSGNACARGKVCCTTISSGVKIEDKKKTKKLKVVGSKSPKGSCSSQGRSCIPQGMARSFPGGTTTRCIGQNGCKKGYLCCKKNTEYKKPKSLAPGKKNTKSSRKSANNGPDRAMKCPPGQRCGTPDIYNPDGGRCRQKCKKKEDSRDNLDMCKNSFCNCCFRLRKCKTLKYCKKKKGECKGVCGADETQLEKGCKNGCVCCVGPKPPSKGTCENETGECKKKKCDEKNGEREFEEYDCGNKKCCLRDCLHWQKNLWYKHGDEFYHDCMLGYCKNGKIKTIKAERHPDCCLNENNYYMEDGSVYCTECCNHTDISYICEKGKLTLTPELAPECEHEEDKNKTKGNRAGSIETRVVYYGPSYERSLTKIQERIYSIYIPDKNTEGRLSQYAPTNTISSPKKQKYKKKENKDVDSEGRGSKKVSPFKTSSAKKHSGGSNHGKALKVKSKVKKMKKN